MKQTYKEASEYLAQAIDMAIDAIQKYPPDNFQANHTEHFIKVYRELKEQCLNPAPALAKVSSLKYIEADVFTFFQEGTGPAVDYFWSQIKAARLDYVKSNTFNKILKRNKIKNQVEFDLVTDTMVAAFQEGSITEAQLNTLKSLLGKFEQA